MTKREWLEESWGGFVVIYFGTPLSICAVVLLFEPFFRWLLNPAPDSVFVLLMIIFMLALGWYAMLDKRR